MVLKWFHYKMFLETRNLDPANSERCVNTQFSRDIYSLSKQLDGRESSQSHKLNGTLKKVIFHHAIFSDLYFIANLGPFVFTPVKFHS